MRPTRTTSHIFRNFLQRNRPTIMLVHTIRASIALTSLFDIQGLFVFHYKFWVISLLIHFIFFKVYHDFEDIDLRRIAEDVHGDSHLSPIIEAMREKFLKYCDEAPLITILANCLRLSFKKKYTIKLLERCKKNLNLPHIREEQCVTSALKKMFNLYNTQLHANQTNQPSSLNPRNIRY
jgi:hypothetical protein